MLKIYNVIIFSLLINLNILYAEFTVAIDPGHSLKSFGAVSSSGITEYAYNIAISKILLRVLNNTKDINAFIINPGGVTIKLSDRTNIANKNHADVFISLHHDSVQIKYLKSKIVHGQKLYSTHKFKGYSIFVSKKNKFFSKSFLLATQIGRKIKAKGFFPTMHHAEKIKGENRPLLNKNIGLYQFDDLIVLKRAHMPAVLIECGVIVNPDEEKAIQDISYHRKIAMAIKEGLITYMKTIKYKD